MIHPAQVEGDRQLLKTLCDRLILGERRGDRYWAGPQLKARSSVIN